MPISNRCATSCSVALAYVAAGWLDGYWEKGVNSWDVGAGSLLVEEAGGIVSDISGSSRFLYIGDIVAGAPGVHAELAGILARYPSLAA